MLSPHWRTNTLTWFISLIRSSAGTLAGYHQYDTKLEDYSQPVVEAEKAALHKYEKRLSAIDANALDQSTRADRELVLANIHSTLLTLEVIRP